jgi:elongation factor Ts
MTEFIKKLRAETGAGMMECKKALDLHQGDYEMAKQSILSQVSFKSENDRVASKGLCGIRILDDEAILYEVNAETDFVVKNEHFVNLVSILGDTLIHSDVTNPKSALNVVIGDMTVSQKIALTSGIIREHVELRRFYRVGKSKDHTFGSYIHQGGKVVTLVIIDQKNQSLANDLAMQVAANSPTYRSIDQIDDNTKAYERFMFEKSFGSTDDDTFLKHLKSMTLYGEISIKHPDETIQTLLEKSSTQVVDFFRFELGQGIENKLNCRLDIPCDGSKITVTPIF